MDNTNKPFAVSREHLIYGLTLPLAALLGFLLAEPLGSNMIWFGCMGAALALPLLMRWYHFLLLATWNAAFLLPFLPGQPPWWMLMTAMGAVIIVMNRCVGLRRPLMVGGPIPKALLLIAAVVLVTAMFTGGAGLRSLGGNNFGGRRYVFLAAAILAYFVITSRTISPRYAFPVVAIFLLSGVTSALSELAAGPLPFLAYVVAPSQAFMGSEYVYGGIDRKMTLGMFSGAVFVFLLAWYGARGLLDLSRPWRLLLLAAVTAVGLFSGFRSSLIVQVLIFGSLFCLERLHRTRYLWILMAGLILAFAALLPFSDRLPGSVQRSISFLPVSIDPVVEADAAASVDWRTGMWREVLPEAKRHFFFGKGYSLSPTDLYMVNVGMYTGHTKSTDAAAVAGDYHNGPLSILVPFGIWGFIAFTVFVAVSIRVMYGYCVCGRPEFANLNRLLLACFVARVASFYFMVGGLDVDLTYLIGVVGVAVSLNAAGGESHLRGDRLISESEEVA